MLWTAALLLAAGCGHTELEMAAKDRQIDALNADLSLARRQLDEEKATLDQTSVEIIRLRDEVDRLGRAQRAAEIEPLRVGRSSSVGASLTPSSSEPSPAASRR